MNIICSLLTELRESIAATKASLDAVYTDKTMNSTCYHLHAVLVHQGQASGGHYWAYIKKKRQPRSGQGLGSHDQSARLHYSSPVATPPDAGQDVIIESQSESEVEVVTPQTGQTSNVGDETGSTDKQPDYIVCESSETSSEPNTSGPHQTSLTSNDGCSDEEVWLKFNDVSVSEVGWHEVERESYGGSQQNTSAYCLLYISNEVWEQLARGEPGMELSPGLREYVEDDNLKFRREMEEYDRRKREKQTQEVRPDGLALYLLL